MQIFSSARLKLTLWYLLIIGFISLTFSFVIYRLQTREINRFEQLQRQRIEARIEQGMGLYNLGPRPAFIYIDEELIAETKSRIIFVLGLFNGSVLLVAGILGYFLAGRTLEPIQKMVVEQERFISDASHELRTPLTVLRTSLEVYERGKSKNIEKANELIHISLQEVIRLQKLSDYLLELSQGKKTLNKTKLNLKSIVETTLNSYAPFARKKRITLLNKVSNIDISADETSLIELLSILTDNAIKYTQGGGQISYSVKIARRKVSLLVKDSGIGISSADLPKIFDRFYRSDAARVKGGYGLGLAIAKNIAKCNGGSLTAVSTPSKGSTFILSLPRA